MIVEIKTVRWDNTELSRKVYEADSIGAALDAHAPDPAENAVFYVTVLLKEVERV